MNFDFDLKKKRMKLINKTQTNKKKTFKKEQVKEDCVIIG